MDAPDPIYVVNEYVRADTYKRMNMTSTECLRSAFEINNETVNVWTSLIIIAAVVTIGRKALTANGSPRRILYILIVIATGAHVITWTMSTLAHSFATHESAEVSKTMWKLDQASVYLSVMSLCNLGLYIEVSPYLPGYVVAMLILGGSTFCGAIMRRIYTASDTHDEDARGMRAVRFAAAIAFYGIPFCCKLATHSAGVSSAFFIASILWYAMGGMFFVSKWPEFATLNKHVHTWCLSHHLWHWCSLCAASTFFYGVLQAVK
jgi:predicted membrane channel-forming protein YqfA (hemolysin III family)